MEREKEGRGGEEEMEGKKWRKEVEVGSERRKGGRRGRKGRGHISYDFMLHVFTFVQHTCHTSHLHTLAGQPPLC